MCLFIACALLDQAETIQALLDLLNSFYGINLWIPSLTLLDLTFRTSLSL